MMRRVFFQLAIGLAFVLLSACAAEESKELKILERVDVLDQLAREPMLAEHPSGDLYVTGYRNASTAPQLWRSEDRGTTWNRVDVGRMEDGAHGNSDVDLVIDDQGNIYFLTMKFTTIPEDTANFDWDMKGEHIAIGVSPDEGQSWTWTYLSQNEYDDRPWVEIASDGSVHVIWNDGRGVHYVVSEDEGQTWQERPDLHRKGGSSHFVAGPNRLLAARIVPMSASGLEFDKGVDIIRISDDAGKTWRDIPVPGNQEWEPFDKATLPRWVEPMAWDGQGKLYYLWSEGPVLKLGVTANLGESWEEYVIDETDGLCYFPYLSVKHAQMGLTWVTEGASGIHHHAAVASLDNEHFAVTKLHPQKLVDLRERSGGPSLSTGGEYYPLIPLSDGHFGMATTIQNYPDNRLGFTWWRLGIEQ
ncbi:MAG: sialidase family protein [Bacteroidota bacterium]